MERFLEKNGARSCPAPAPQIEAGDAAYHTSVAEASSMEVSAAPSSTPPQQGDMQTQDIAKAVADILTPTITATVERAVSAGILLLKKELGEHSTRFNEAEHRLSNLEDEVYQSHEQEIRQDKTNQYILQTLDDLENRFRRSNLRFVGFPESLQAPSILDLCSKRIPELLGLPAPCPVERAHGLGPPSPDRTTPRAVIAKYLNYADKSAILQKFRQHTPLMVDGVKILIFADYSKEVSNKCKAFQQICSGLFLQQIKFTLAYPAILRLKARNGDQLAFHDPAEAESFLRSLTKDHSPGPAPRASPTGRPLEQRSPRKDSPKCPRTSGASSRNRPR